MVLTGVGASEPDLAGLIAELIENPQAGDRIIGLRGVRKVRFSIPSRRIGKSGGGRAIYLLIQRDDVIFLLLAYAKNEQSDLSTRQRQQVLAFLEDLDNGQD